MWYSESNIKFYTTRAKPKFIFLHKKCAGNCVVRIQCYGGVLCTQIRCLRNEEKTVDIKSHFSSHYWNSKCWKYKVGVWIIISSRIILKLNGQNFLPPSKSQFWRLIHGSIVSKWIYGLKDVNLTDLTQDRAQWWTFVMAVPNSWVLE